MVVWLRPEYILAFVTSLYYCSQLVISKTYDKFWCATEEGRHQLSCPDETALLTDIAITKVYRRTEMCEPDFHSEYLIQCQSHIDIPICEGNKTCLVEISSRDYLQCADKTYTPTYFYVKYTCTQIHTMCKDTTPIRNTLHGFITSPDFPHPMADNLKCSITIEADPSMVIEISPVEIHLQEAIKCRGEYVEIFGYDLKFGENTIDKSDNWKEYHTWCGAEGSPSNPPSNARYLIPSNSLYVSLQTGISGYSRYFKIRYKIIPSSARFQYNSDGIPYESNVKGQKPSLMVAATVTAPTKTSPNVSVNHTDVRNLNQKLTKRTKKKGILIGSITGVIVFLIAIGAGVLTFILIKRRRSPAKSNTRKKNTPTTSNAASKSAAKSPDKAPLLEKSFNTSTNTTKQKLVPERTLQVSDVSSSRFKSSEIKTTKPGTTNSETTSPKPTLTAVDSGIYGVDLPEDNPTATKPLSQTTSDPRKAQNTTSSETKETLPTVVVNPLSEDATPSNPIISDDDEQRQEPLTNKNEEKQPLLDHTVESAYIHSVRIASSESGGTLCGSGLGSRRSSFTNEPLLNQETTVIETIILADETETVEHHHIPFNPLHVILQKDANKYYTTEYI